MSDAVATSCYAHNALFAKYADAMIRETAPRRPRVRGHHLRAAASQRRFA